VLVDSMDEAQLEQLVQIEAESSCGEAVDVELTPEIFQASDQFADMLNGVLNYWLAQPGHYPPPGNPEGTSNYQYDMSEGFEVLIDNEMSHAAYDAYQNIEGAGSGIWDNWEHLYPGDVLDTLIDAIKNHPGMRTAYQRLQRAIMNAVPDCSDDDPGDVISTVIDGGESLGRTVDRAVSVNDGPPRMYASP
jgi:hypothetical protein